MGIYAKEYSLQNNESLSTTSIKKVAIYARVSTNEQAEEGYSIDEQVRLLRDWCKSHGYEVYKEYVDRGISGKSIKGRPALRQLLADAKQKCFDIVVVWKMNRLARNILDLLKIVDLLEKSNISFRSYTENYETETSSGKFQFHVMAAFAEFERANIAENVKMGMLARAKEGSWNGGQVLGYDTIEDTTKNGKRKTTRLVVNEKEAQTVRRIFQLYVEGNGYKSIANTINKEGHRTKKNNFFSINAVKTILTNPIYIGYIRYNVRRNWAEKRRNNINPNPILVKGNHTPIISQEIWDKAQAIMKNRSKQPNRIHSGEYPLTGLLKCPSCGAGMVLGRTTNRNKDGTKRVLEYYVCGAWKNKGTAVCNSNGIRTEYADQYVLNKIATFANNDQLIKDVVERLNQSYQETTEPFLKEYKAIEKEIHKIEARKEKVLGLYEEGILSKEELVQRLKNLNEEKKLLEERLVPIEQRLRTNNQQEISFKIVKEVMENFVTCFNETITTDQKKRLLQLLINKITINKDRKIESIQIQVDNEVIKYFVDQGEGKSSDEDDFSSPFSIIFNI